MSSKRIIVVGGVAGGASAAARARRLSEEAEIIVFERGPHVSFANCGLPYYVGGEIQEEKALLLQTPETLRARFNLDVRVHSEVVSIDRKAKSVKIRELTSGREYDESYDALVLAPGALPIKPPLAGIDREGHFTVRNIPDVERIKKWLREGVARDAVVVGGGYIGLEMAEQLKERGLNVTVVEALPQLMAPLDPEMAGWITQELRAHGVEVILKDAVASFEAPRADERACASVVVLKSGRRLVADLVVLGLGVRPDTKLAKEAGLEIGATGGIRVNDRLQTSDPSIWAVGDAVEVRDVIGGIPGVIPLAGPANRQGRITADNILGRDSRYQGTYGTAIVRVFKLAAACTGANEKCLSKCGVDYHAVHLHPGSHAGYYPGAAPIAIKLLFDPGTGKLLGAQAVGTDGVDKRIDVLATALKAGMTVHDLAELELAYAPPFGSAKDPINLAGMAAQNVLAGDVALAQWHEVKGLDKRGAFLLDVRTDAERKGGFIPGSTHIPLHELRNRLDELPTDREIVVSCQSGQRSYFACRLLNQRGFRTRNLTGSYRTWKTAVHAEAN